VFNFLDPGFKNCSSTTNKTANPQRAGRVEDKWHF